MGKSERGSTRRSRAVGEGSRGNIVPPFASSDWNRWPYRIGCPVWGCRHWGGAVYPKGSPSSEGLAWYSRMFPTVEGNSTFYSVPPAESFLKWSEQAASGFRFCFKFPRAISHEHQLVGCDGMLKEWIERLDILASNDRLGPTFLQLGPSFSFAQFPQLAHFLKQLPSQWPWALEVRHRDWFDEGDKESRLEDLLRSLSIDRVIFDSRPLNALEASDASESASQVRKPKVPLRTTVTGRRPMVRLIGRNDVQEVSEYWDEWAQTLCDWIIQGLEPWIFTHAPDDTYAPSLVVDLHSRLQRKLEERETSIRLESLPTLESYSLAASERSAIDAQSVQESKLGQDGKPVQEGKWVQGELF